MAIVRKLERIDLDRKAFDHVALQIDDNIFEPLEEVHQNNEGKKWEEIFGK